MTGAPEDPALAAMHTFVDFIGEVVQFTASALGGVKIANRLHNWGHDLGIHKQPRRSTAEHFQILQGLVLIASWGAFEAFFEDFCRAVLARDAQVTDSYEAYRRLVQNNRNRKADINFEKTLTGIDRQGPIPTSLLEELKNANQIRNIWAHNRGVVNEIFATSAPDLGYTVGDKVTMAPDQYIRYLFALGTYAAIITARDMVKTGRPVPPANALANNPFQGEYAALFSA